MDDNDAATGGPIIADGLVWTIGADNAVHGLSLASSKQAVSIPFGGSANHFPTPSAADGVLLLPGIKRVFAFMGRCRRLSRAEPRVSSFFGGNYQNELLVPPKLSDPELA